jgi:hypothetical protein
MSEQLRQEDLIHESLDEEMERKGTAPVPDWLNVKKQVRSGALARTSSFSGVKDACN